MQRPGVGPMRRPVQVVSAHDTTLGMSQQVPYITGTINIFIYQQLLPYRIIKQLTYLYITSTAPLQQNHLSPGG